MNNVMESDPLIDEIREVRRKISAEFGNDPQRLVAHYMELEREARRTGKYKFRDAPAGKPDGDLVLRDKPRKKHK
jgi:hypothetical protein